MSLEGLLSSLQKAPRKYVPATVNRDLLERVDFFLEGSWGLEDVLEMAVDEISTSASVGTGVDSAIGSSARREEDDEDDPYKKLAERVVSRLADAGRIKRSEIKEFLERSVPDPSGAVHKKVMERLQKDFDVY